MRKAIKANYKEICEELGFNAECGFVKITSAGTIGFTVGKPDEIRALYRAVINAGYKPTKEFEKRMRNI